MGRKEHRDAKENEKSSGEKKDTLRLPTPTDTALLPPPYSRQP